jgi:hypothetical protein
MGQTQCPVCYIPLEVRDVTPCFICGGWPEALARFDPAAEFMEFRQPHGRTLVLCRSCQLEEFMVPGGWGYRLVPGEKLPVNGLQRVRVAAGAAAGAGQVLSGMQLAPGILGSQCRQ